MTTVRVVGTGLLGTSIGMALSAKGFRVQLHDTSPTSVALARDLGAGEVGDEAADVVVVATPPDVAASVVAQQLRDQPDAIVTDVASVKQTVLEELRGAVDGDALARYVGSHPMAGRERSGAVAARADLFEGRTWVVCPHETTSDRARAAIDEIARAAGASVVTMPAAEHDLAVAAVSHLPQVAASLVAARLRDLPDDAVGLAGPGVRDVTRIAASDPLLWTQILAGNAANLLPVLDAVADDLDRVRAAVRAIGEGESAATGARGVLAQTIADGQTGHARLPGKHGAPPTAYASLIVVLPDRPRQLAQLFADVGNAGINLEDLRIEHAVGAQVGLAELMVLPAALEPLQEALTAAGWRLHS